jgi:glycerol-3-phosphate O-acyltransferase
MHEHEAANLAYYRNNILHLVAIPSLIASYFLHYDRVLESDLVRAGKEFYPFLKAEFFLRWTIDSSEKVVKRVIDGLVSQGLLMRNDNGYIERPAVTSRDLTSLFFLARSLSQLLERYAIASHMLANYKQGVERQVFEEQCSLMAQRIAILHGINSLELQDPKLYKGFVDELRRLGYAELSEQNLLKPTDKIIALARDSAKLLSADIRSSITRMQGVN